MQSYIKIRNHKGKTTLSVYTNWKIYKQIKENLVTKEVWQKLR